MDFFAIMNAVMKLQPNCKN